MLRYYSDKGTVKETKNKMLTILMTETEFDKIKRATEKDEKKRSMSQIARDGIKKEIRRVNDE